MGISGTWYNELGSMMQLTEADGALGGIYNSAVGHAEYEYTLVGRYDTEPGSGGQAMSWTVVWQNAYGNSQSATAWAGQYQTLAGGEEEIFAMWLLASEVEDPGDDWSATQVGQDIFSRVAPTEDEIQAHRARRSASHPATPSA